ncbi:MAG: hypothetical protein AAGG80_06790 [Pseudomonadota bacterium]
MRYILLLLCGFCAFANAYNQSYVSVNDIKKSPYVTKVKRTAHQQLRTYHYSDQAKSAWFKNCLRAKSNPQVSQYAFSYCQCGWQGITHNIPPSMFTTNNAAQIKRRNTLLKVITQECVVKILSAKQTK